MEQNRNTGIVRQRTVRTEEQILAILEEYEASGLTAKEYCEISEINEATFYSWMRKYRSKAETEGRGGFAAIEEIPTLVHSRPQLFAEVGNIRLYKEVPAEYLKTLLS
jgi:transposase-like protein